jgi:biopolymer transport protein ExbD
MTITFACPQCGKKLSASEKLAGRQRACPRCGATISVPSVEQSPRPQRPSASHRSPSHSAPGHAALLMRRHGEHSENLIDMTAMVDIVFFLLIFFLVTSMQSLEAVIGLPTPQTESAADSVQTVPDYSEDPNFIIVTIDADDAVWVEDEEALSEQELRSKLRAARQDGERDGMLVNGDAEATHGTFVMVLDAGADAGMKELLFSVPESEVESTEGG